MIDLSVGTWNFKGSFSVLGNFADSPILSSRILLIESVTVPTGPNIYTSAGCYQLFQTNNMNALGENRKLKIGTNLIIFSTEIANYKLRIFPYNWIRELDINIWEFVP